MTILDKRSCVLFEEDPDGELVVNTARVFSCTVFAGYHQYRTKICSPSFDDQFVDSAIDYARGRRAKIKSIVVSKKLARSLFGWGTEHQVV